MCGHGMVPATKFIEASGKAFNTIPPTDFGFYEMIRAEGSKGEWKDSMRSTKGFSERRSVIV